MTFLKKLTALITGASLLISNIPFTASAEESYDELTYEVLGNEIKITECSDTVEEYEIPSEIDGFPVTKIGDDAFSYNIKLKNVIIPDTVKEIDWFAFYHCENLEKIVIPDSVKTIGNHSFAGCYSLKSVNLPKSLQVIPSGAFQYCKALESIELPEEITNISNLAFGSCESLTSITIPYSTREIDHAAFQDCYNLKEVIIKSPDLTLGSVSFDDCHELTDIIFPTEYECSFDADHSFTLCPKLTSITIPKNVTYIGSDSFEWSKITTIYGYKGSAAEEYANSHYIGFKKTITFIALDEEPVVTETTDTSAETTITETTSAETTTLTDTSTKTTTTETAPSTETTTTEENIIKGDINGDSLVNIGDVIMIRKFILNFNDMDNPDMQNADINGDLKINVYDLALLKKFIR